MPELPDLEVYREAIAARTLGQPLERVRLGSPFVLRSAEPPIAEAAGRRVVAVRRLGKRLVLGLEGDLFLCLHLMIAGRLHWRERGARLPGRAGLAAFDFPAGTLVLTEAGRSGARRSTWSAARPRSPRSIRAVWSRSPPIAPPSPPRSGARTTP